MSCESCSFRAELTARQCPASKRIASVVACLSPETTAQHLADETNSVLDPGPEIVYRFDLYRENYLGFWQILSFLAGAEKQANRLLLLDSLIRQRGKDA